MPHLTLAVDSSKPLGDGLFSQLELDGVVQRVATKEFDGDLKANAKKGIEALCFLIVLTEYQRQHGIKILSTTYQAKLKTIAAAWDPKKGQSRRWMNDFFRIEPFPLLLTLDTAISGQSVAFTDNIELKVEHILSESEFTASEIQQLYLIIGSEAALKPKTLKIEVETPDFTISSEHCKGALTKGHLVRLFFETNFPCGFLVFWVDSLNGLAELYPSLEIENFPGMPFQRPDSARDKQLSIPGEGKLHVGTPPGLESCLVFTKSERFTQSETKTIRALLFETLPFRAKEFHDGRPAFKPLLFGESETPGEVNDERLEAPPLESEWEASLQSVLHPHAERLWLFNIPNESS